jgi:hypothetical protein
VNQRTFEREHEYRKSALATVDTHGDERTAVLLLCRVLARLDEIEDIISSQDAE